jgi:hypothetical protein
MEKKEYQKPEMTKHENLDKTTKGGPADLSEVFGA